MWYLTHCQTKQPLYKQIIHLIEQAIETGQLQAGDKLPSERQLCDLLKVNRSTIIHALTVLSDNGILIRKLGSGTYVNHQKWGVQNSPLINWQISSSILAKPKQDSYVLQANLLRNEQNTTILDLANGDLPHDLLPILNLPYFSWQEILHHEQGNEASYLGLKSFRISIQNYLQEQFGMSIPIEQILITSGAQQAIFLITQGLLKPGDAIGIEAPSYFYSLPLFQAAGLRIYAIPTDREGITLDGLDRQLKRFSLKMIFLNPIFQNPTGFIMTEHRKKQILTFCNKKGIPIVEDDAYSALSFNAQQDITPIKKLDNNQQVIYVGSLSKYIGKNVRAGWMVAPCNILHKLADIRQQLDAGLSVLPQLLAQHYLNKHSQEHQLFLQKKLSIRANDLINYLNHYFAGLLTFYPPSGGFHLYCESYAKNNNQLNQLLQKFIKHNILVSRGIDFGDTPYQLRLSYPHFNMTKHPEK